MPTISGRSSRRKTLGLSLAIASVLSLSGCFNVALFGDVPYSTSQEPAYERLISNVNAEDVAFSVHVGDIQASSNTCTDATVNKNINWFDSFEDPLIYTPGDNEWTDCSNPLTRLDQLRQLVFRGTGTLSRGQNPRALATQAGYPENARWTQGGVTFVTVHVVGSSDGSSNATEWQARRSADLAWLAAAFTASKARGDVGIVVITHSGLRFDRAEGAKGSYESMFQAVRSETLAYPGQVLYVHGDGHTFTDDRPMLTAGGQPVANFHRVEVPGGSGTVKWLRLVVVESAPDPFSIQIPPVP